MFLELRVIPVKYVIMSKRLKYLKHILNESTSTMLKRVFETLKGNSRKGYFVDLVHKYFKKLKIEHSESKIKSCTE